jgi:signal transduction histidine kinase
MMPPAHLRPLTGVALALFASAWMCPSASAQAPSSRTVLTVHWGTEDFPANVVVDAAIRGVLASSPDLDVDYFAEYLESDRFGAEAAPVLGDYIRQKYRGRRIDLVIAITNASLQFVLDHRGELFSDAPIVFAGLAVPDDVTRNAGRGLAAVRVANAFAETLRLALTLHPSTDRVFVVARSQNKESVATVRAELEAFSPRVRLTFMDEETVPDLLAAVAAVPPGSLILFVWQSQLQPGTAVYSDKIAQLVAEASKVPVYGTSDFYIGSGIVGGVVRGTRETGARVGEIAHRILSGARPQDIPVEATRTVPVVDWRQVRRWNIDPSRLPPGSDTRFRQPTVWESYRWSIVAAGLVVAAQMLLISGLVTQQVRRRRAERTIRAREAALRASYERIRQLTGRLMTSQEATRAGIARDLHDDVCQELVAVVMQVGSLKSLSGSVRDPPTQDALSRLEETALDIVGRVRSLSHDLHPSTLRLLGLADALEAHCIEAEKRYDVQVAFSREGDLERIHADAALSLFRIAQEALRNSVSHGAARRLSVKLARSGQYVELTVTDDGYGFDVEAVRQEGGGLGLVSIEERARLVGGEVRITTRPGHGASVCVRVPARPPADGDEPVDATRFEADAAQNLTPADTRNVRPPSMPGRGRG